MLDALPAPVIGKVNAAITTEQQCRVGKFGAAIGGDSIVRLACQLLPSSAEIQSASDCVPATGLPASNSRPLCRRSTAMAAFGLGMDSAPSCQTCPPSAVVALRMMPDGLPASRSKASACVSSKATTVGCKLPWVPGRRTLLRICPVAASLSQSPPCPMKLRLIGNPRPPSAKAIGGERTSPPKLANGEVCKRVALVQLLPPSVETL